MKKVKTQMTEFSEEVNKLIDLAFPAINCPIKPLGNRILVQIRSAQQKTASGIILTSDNVEDIYRNEQTAKVIKVGNGAFRFASSGESWPTGDWVQVGDYVRVPLHGGDNHWIVEGDNKILFKSFKDYELIGLIEGNPLEVKTNMAYF